MPNDIILRCAGGVRALRGQDHFWRVIRRLGRAGGLFSVDDVRGLSNEPRRTTIAEFMSRLERGGYIRRAGRAEGAGTGRRRIVYALARPQLATPRVDRAGRPRDARTRRQAMWNVMRGPITRDGFTARDLVIFASTDGNPVGLAGAKSYIAILAKAGYLVTVTASRGGRPTVWRLKPSMNSGPLPPRDLGHGRVYDQNRDRVVAP